MKTSGLFIVSFSSARPARKRAIVNRIRIRRDLPRPPDPNSLPIYVRHNLVF